MDCYWLARDPAREETAHARLPCNWVHHHFGLGNPLLQHRLPVGVHTMALPGLLDCRFVHTTVRHDDPWRGVSRELWKGVERVL